jgi:hypothetical protein
VEAKGTCSEQHTPMQLHVARVQQKQNLVPRLEVSESSSQPFQGNASSKGIHPTAFTTDNVHVRRQVALQFVLDLFVAQKYLWKMWLYGSVVADEAYVTKAASRRKCMLQKHRFPDVWSQEDKPLFEFVSTCDVRVVNVHAENAVSTATASFSR